MSNKKNFSFVKTTFLAIASMVAYNTYELKKATNTSELTKESRLEYTGKFGKIAYKKTGNGMPVLLIHDLDACACLEEWSNAAKRLSANNTVYSIDLPGCAMSEKTYVEYSAYMYALAINDFIKNVINKENAATLTAISAGSTSDLLACAANIEPDLYNNVVFANPKKVEYTYCNPLTNTNILKAMRHVLNAPIIGSFIFNLIYNRKRIMSKLNTNEYSHLSQSEKDFLADARFEAAHTGGFNSKYLLSSIRSDLLNSNIDKMLSKLSVPCTIVAGEGVKSVEKTIVSYCKSGSNIRLVRVEGVATPQLEAVNRFAEVINEL